MITSDRILVTGARGFLGAHIVKCARSRGRDVVPTSRTAADDGSIALDVCHQKSVDTVFRTIRPAIVVHCAAYGVNYADQDVHSALAVNVHGSLSLLAAAAHYGVQRLVHVGSCFEYGTKAGPINEDTALSPTAIYGASKAAATLVLMERAQALGVHLVVARPFGMWGVGEPAYRLVPQVIAACLGRLPLKLTPCEVVRDLTYVEDMAANILDLALLRDVLPATIVNVGSGQGILLREFVLSIARLLDGEDLMQFGALTYRPTEMPSLVADVSKIRQLIGHAPKTSLEDGVLRMIAARGLARSEEQRGIYPPVDQQRDRSKPRGYR